MHTVLLVFEFLGTPELLLIALAALILFGPRKLPEIGRSLGKGIAEFKRASDDFKRTWEYEVEIESRKPSLDAGQSAQIVGDANVAAEANVASLPSAGLNAEESADHAAQPHAEGEPIARTSSATHAPDKGTGDFAGEGAWDIATGRTRASAVHDRANEDEINAS
jgi:sec-independent protein translocase protein TatA